MVENYLILPSKTQSKLLLTLSLAGSLCLLYALDSTWLAVTTVALICLLLARRRAELKSIREMVLRLHKGDESVTLEVNGQPYFFGKYKVYPTRWFAILKLIDQRHYRTLFLYPDSFKSAQEYQTLRYSLSKSGSKHVA